MNNRFLIACCGVMLSLNAISCEVLLPSFFELERVFGADRATVQMVIPIYLMAAACGQIVFGPLSDRFGRRPLLRVGLAIYITGALAALLAPSLQGVFAARAMQGFGAACLIVVSRAILRDVFSGPDLGRAMAIAMGIFTVGPMFGPAVGVVALWLGGWKGAFLAMAAIGVLLMGIALFAIRETLSTPDPRALEPARLGRAIARLFAHPQSRHFLFVLSLMQVVIVVFISTAPGIFARLGASGGQFALLFAVAASGILVGQALNTRLIAKFGMLNAMRAAAVLSLAIAMITARMAPTIGLTGYVILIFLFNAFFLANIANSLALVLDPHKDIAGTASATLGFVTQFTGSIMALVILPRLDGTVTSWALVHLAFLATAAVLVFAFRPAIATEAPASS